ncbi:hypothetical protein BJ944DRAFT_251326 [Cunninghamella echinulata]|nr:hypothetical protein BJ944DRAFT_251326 [Cunninghamella echinulata]
MDSFRSTGKLSIQVENDSLVMFGNSIESAGCVLRGVLRFSLTQPLKVKSINVRFICKSIYTWSEPLGNGDKLYHEEANTILDENYHCLPRQTKLHTLPVGDHSYNFEFILRGNLPETTNVTNFYQVDYKLKAIVERPAFIPNQSTRQSIHVSRQLFSPFSPEFMEPIYMMKRCEQHLEMLVTMPTKIYAYGDTIPLTIYAACLHPHLKLKLLCCNLKEYIILRENVASKMDEHSRAHGRHLFSTKVNHFHSITSLLPTTNHADHGDAMSYLLSSLASNEIIDNLWTKQFNITLPNKKTDMHCDIGNDMVQVKHKFKFILDLHHTLTGENLQLRMAVPIHICALSLNTNELPPYEASPFDREYFPLHEPPSLSASFLSLPPQQQQQRPLLSSSLLLSSSSSNDLLSHPSNIQSNDNDNNNNNNNQNNDLPSYQDIFYRGSDRLPSYDEPASTLTAY